MYDNNVAVPHAGLLSNMEDLGFVYEHADATQTLSDAAASFRAHGLVGKASTGLMWGSILGALALLALLRRMC